MTPPIDTIPVPAPETLIMPALFNDPVACVIAPVVLTTNARFFGPETALVMFKSAGFLIHLLIIFAVISLVMHLLTGRKA